MFFSEYIHTKYESIIYSCHLERDFEQFDNNDETIVGDSGCNLSGGQQQRVNLARCSYRNADVYLFDDPLSAVDPQLQAEIFDRLLSNENGYLKNRVIHFYNRIL